jgi:hypothetical protein
MKLTTEPGALAGAVRFAARALTARTAYPILGCLKITADPGGSVEVSAFDYQTSARARTEAEVSEPGTVLAPGRLLAEITARLPRQPADLAHDGTALTLACGSTPVPAAPAAAGHLPAAARAGRPGRARGRGRVRARIALTTPDKAALISPADGDGQADDPEPAYRHLLAPIRSAG